MAELEYIQEKTDWARVVETADSARIVPPDRPPRHRLFDGPIVQRIASWMAIGLLASFLAGVALAAHFVAARLRAKPPASGDYGTLVLLAVLVGLGVLFMVGMGSWLFIAGSLPEKCEILVHVSGVVVRRFSQGRWSKTEIERGGVRTVLISGMRTQPISTPAADEAVFVALLCEGGSAPSVSLGRYERALARDIAQAVIDQHRRLGIVPVPRLLDLCDRRSVTERPPGEPRWHRIERSGSEVRIVPAEPSAAPAPRPRIVPFVIGWTVIAALFLAGWWLHLEPLQVIAAMAALFAGMATLGLVMRVLFGCQQRTYVVTPDTLTVVKQHVGRQSRSVVQRNAILSIRVSLAPEMKLYLEAVPKGGWPKILAHGPLDATGELAAILGQELAVPVTTMEERPQAMTAAGPAAEEIVEPARHYVQVHREGESVILHKPRLGLIRARAQIIFALVGGAMVLAGLAITLLVVPGLADRGTRAALTLASIFGGALGTLLVAAAVGEMIESYRFEMMKTCLVMRRTLPWGTRHEQWDLGQIADIRIEGQSLLVLEDWTGKVHRLVFWGHTPSIRYTAALLRKHLAEMRQGQHGRIGA